MVERTKQRTNNGTMIAPILVLLFANFSVLTPEYSVLGLR